MKKILILFFTILFGIQFNSFSQEHEEIVDKLTSISAGTYLKDFQIKLPPNGTARYSVVLSKNTRYEFSFYQSNTNQLGFELFGGRQEQKIEISKQSKSSEVEELNIESDYVIKETDTPITPSEINKNKKITVHEYLILQTGIYHLLIKNNTSKSLTSGVLLTFLNKEYIQPDRESNQPEFADITDEIKKGKNYFFTVDEMPKFKYQKFTKFIDFINKSIIYPQEAIEKGIEGKVNVQFIINKDGYIKEAKIVRGSHPSIDQEALRVVYSSPRWKPGIKDGESVDVILTYPIEFKFPE